MHNINFLQILNNFTTSFDVPLSGQSAIKLKLIKGRKPFYSQYRWEINVTDFCCNGSVTNKTSCMKFTIIDCRNYFSLLETSVNIFNNNNNNNNIYLLI